MAPVCKIVFNIFTGDTLLQSHALIVENGQIKDIVNANNIPTSIEQLVDLHGNTMVPGFIDLQVNGGGGVMFNSQPNLAGIKKILKGHQRFGTTGMLPTLITTSYENMHKAVSAVTQAIAENTLGVIGIHLEGPFLNETKKGDVFYLKDTKVICPGDDEPRKIGGVSIRIEE